MRRAATFASAILMTQLAAAREGRAQDAAGTSLALREEPAPLNRTARLVVSNLTLEAALRELHRVAKVDLLFSPTSVAGTEPVSCDCHDVTVREALDRLVRGTMLRYVEIGRMIVIADRARLDPAGFSRPVPAELTYRHAGLRLGDVEGARVEFPPAQAGEIRGIVHSRRGQPIVGARVSVVGQEVATTTAGDGSFRLAGVQGREVSLSVSAIGYRPLRQTVLVGTRDVRVTVDELAVNLDEVVVTGTAGAAQRRSLGNAVARIDAADVAAVAPIQDMGQLLNARAPGVVINQGTGAAGGGNRILIRGISSLTSNGNPLVYVDGVRVNNDVNRSIPGGATEWDAAISRLNDFSPRDIESIEIIKGPAAATLYGTEAAAGVIQIITKKGRVGRPEWDFEMLQGAAALNNAENVFPLTYARDASGAIQSLNIVQSEGDRGTPIFRTGHIQDYRLGVTGGSDLIKYRLAAGFASEEGIVPKNQIDRISGRASLTLTPHPKLTVDASLGLLASRGDYYSSTYPFNVFNNSPALLNTASRGFLLFPPEVDLATSFFTQDVNRSTASLNITHQPARWFTHRVSLGADLTSEDGEGLNPTVPTEYEQYFTPAQRLGSKAITRKDATYTTLDYSATATVDLTESLGSGTSAGLQYYRRYEEVDNLSGQQFSGPGIVTIGGTTIRTASDDYLENTTVGVYLQQQFSWKDRLFVTGAIRADDNSSFGGNFDLVTYPKVSASWVVSEGSFFGPIGTLRLRAAYGETGQQPASFSALQTFTPITGAGERPSGTPGSMGNPDLGPERGQELEFGFEAGLFNERMSIDFTYYNRRIEDVIVPRTVPPSVGFPAVQFINAGEMTNRGVEMLITGRLIDGEKLDWDLGLNFSTNRNRVESLGIPGVPFLTVGFLPNRHQPGYPSGAYFQRRILSAEFDANNRAINIMCDSGSDAAPVPCNAAAPQVYFGSTIPATEGAVTSTLTWAHSLTLYAMVDFKADHVRLNAQHFIPCTSRRFEEINFYPERFAPVEVAECQLGLGYSAETGGANFVQDASFAKLREISLSYQLPDGFNRSLNLKRSRVTLSGRNLHTWTSWTGVDPETFTSGNFLASNHNQTMLPLPSQWTVSFSFAF